MPCDVGTRQNTPDALRLVRAFREGYAGVKRVGRLQVALSVLAMVFGFVADRWLPDAKGWVALCSIAFVLYDAAFLEPAAKAKQQAAALIQEEFDGVVLELPWTKTERPDPEHGLGLAAEHAKSHGKRDTQIKDWYPATVDALPIEQARLICQRSNMWWDASLRAGVWKLYLGGILGLVIGAIAWAMTKKLAMDQFIPVCSTSLLPAGLQLLRKLREHAAAAAESESAKRHVDKLQARVARGEVPLDALGREAQALQEEIYQRRRSAPPVPEWAYARRKKAYEHQMKEAAKAMVAEALHANEAASREPTALEGKG